MADQDRASGHSLDPRDWLTGQIDKATAEERPVDALMLALARDAIDIYGSLMIAVRGHRFDTTHLVEKLGEQGYRPRLADQMLYDAAGLDRVEVPDAE